IVSDIEMASLFNGKVNPKFMPMTAWTLDEEGYYAQYRVGANSQILPTMRYYNSMESRLHFFDGNGMKQYRLVHESWAGQSDEAGYKQVYNYLFGGSIPETDTG